jgi:predicted CXXCH cytochrome family protein
MALVTPFTGSTVILWILVGGAIALLLRGSRGTGRARFIVAATMGAAALGAFGLAQRRAEDALPPVPTASQSEYVSSSACRSCHPSEYASWHKSYHRTMTQAATARTVLAPLEDEAPVALTLDGASYGIEKRGESVWATLPEREAENGGAKERRVVLTTGSHHYQAYWLEGARTGDFRLFPFVYLLGQSAGWIPRRDAFVAPPEAKDPGAHWSSNCIQCHATAGRPGRDSNPETLLVAELGIACEACHGPGGAHVARYRDPIERYAAYAKDRPDTTLVNPSRLSAEQASMICGTCHSFTFPRDEEDFWANGYRAYRPGQDLRASRVLLTSDALRNGAPGMPSLDTDVNNLFYEDGTVRIGGREYNGMTLSACFLRGEGDRKLSCLSCHAMHYSEPDDQLTYGREGDAACASCHDRDRYWSISHTHHAEGSVGASCLGCHMPKTAYALLKSIRSHRIDSPKAKDLASSDRPNACNLCHLDRPLGWTSGYLASWYGQAAPSETPDASVPAGATWLLAGDPGQRAIAAAAMSEPGALAAVPGDFEAPLLASALEDPYAAVRFIAQRSLGHLPGFERHPKDSRPLAALIAARSTRALTLSE